MNRFLTFVIGVLFGSIITILGIMFYINSINSDVMRPNDNGEMYKPGEMGEPPQKPDGEIQRMPMDFNQG